MAVTYFALNPGDLERMRSAIGALNDQHPIAGGRRTLCLLTSYFYFNAWTMKRLRDALPEVELRVFVDSGGFSGMTLGGIGVYANLDAIGDPKKTLRNQEIMEAEGLSPIPVFHVNSDLRHLDELVERNYPYIAFGGMVPYMKHGGQKKLVVWLRGAFARLKDKPIKVHGFGVGTTWSVVKNFPWYSTDSSSWIAPFKYRFCRLFDERRGRFVGVDFRTQTSNAMEHAPLIRAYGFSLRDFYPHYREDKGGALAVMGLLRAEAWLEQRC